jgi:hypothetical protein
VRSGARSLTGTRVLGAVCLCAAALLAAPPVAGGVTHGFSRVLSPNSTSAGVGYGPGWVALTFDTHGAPHGPIIGTLLYQGVGDEPAADHMDIYREHGPAASVPGPFAGGYAYGNFDGCAWAYSARKFFHEGGHHEVPCTKPPNHSTRIFCHNHKVDRLCNDGKSHASAGETEAGVWKKIKASYARAKTGAAGCDAFANVGSHAIYNGAAVNLVNRVGFVPAQTRVKVRYVTKDRGAVMALVPSGLLQQGMRWAFLRRDCVA